MCIDVNIVGINTPQNLLTHFTIIILSLHMLAFHMFVQISFLFWEVSTISTQPSSINFFHLLMNLSVNIYWQIKIIRLGLDNVYFLLKSVALLLIGIFMNSIQMDIVGIYTLTHFATQLTGIILCLNMFTFNVFEKIAFVVGLIITVRTRPILSRPQHLGINFILNSSRI